MKKITTIMALTGCLISQAQTRVSLYEEFTGENCPPCAVTNPGLDYLLNAPQNVSKVINIKWQTPIPSIPQSSWSLYQTNKGEIDWRYKSVGDGAYGYPSTLYSPPANYVNHAPTGMMDGQEMNAFGLNSAHPYYMTDAVINVAQGISTNFSINMDTQWDVNFNNCAVTITVTSSSAFTAAGNLNFRLCLVEELIEFSTAPGTNGEKIFHNAVRKSYPTTTSGSQVTSLGTVMPGTWTAGQQHVFTVNCAIPNYIIDKSEMAFVGFVQDDGNQKIYQAAKTPPTSIPDDAKVVSVNIPQIICTNQITPNVTIKNNGPTAITSITIAPRLDLVYDPNFVWVGNLAPLTSTTIVLPSITTAAGTHTFGCKVIGVSNGDAVTANNDRETIFVNSSAFNTQQITEGFELAQFPPANWIINNTGTSYTFEKSSLVGGGYGTSGYSITYPLFYSPVGERDEIMLPPTNISSINQPQLKFDIAYRQENTTSNDSLNVFVSTNCGTSWQKVFGNGGANLATAVIPFTPSSFYPSSFEWVTHTISLSSYTNTPDLLVKFQVYSDRGNGFCLDNINLVQGTPAGFREQTINAEDIILSPNPAKETVTVSIKSFYDSKVNITLTNVLGETISNAGFFKTSEEIKLDCGSHANGVYFIVIDDGNTSVTKKLVISR